MNKLVEGKPNISVEKLKWGKSKSLPEKTRAEQDENQLLN
jgi:hypothetical protein